MLDFTIIGNPILRASFRIVFFFTSFHLGIGIFAFSNNLRVKILSLHFFADSGDIPFRCKNFAISATVIVASEPSVKTPLMLYLVLIFFNQF